MCQIRQSWILLPKRWCKKTPRWSAKTTKGKKSHDSSWDYCSPQVEIISWSWPSHALHRLSRILDLRIVRSKANLWQGGNDICTFWSNFEFCLPDPGTTRRARMLASRGARITSGVTRATAGTTAVQKVILLPGMKMKENSKSWRMCQLIKCCCRGLIVYFVKHRKRKALIYFFSCSNRASHH